MVNRSFDSAAEKRLRLWENRASVPLDPDTTVVSNWFPMDEES